MLDEEGRVCVQKSAKRAASGAALEGGAPRPGSSNSNIVGSGEDVAKALELSQAAPDSMKFFSVEDLMTRTRVDADANGAAHGRRCSGFSWWSRMIYHDIFTNKKNFHDSKTADRNESRSVVVGREWSSERIC